VPGRVAVIGAGAFGRFCIDAYRRSGDIEVVVAVDPDGSALAQVNGPGIRRETRWQAVLTDETVEVLHLATPPWIRGAIAGAALRAGKSVFCEKPLALTIEEADAMIAATRQSGAALGVDYVLRHLPAYRMLEALASTGLFGSPCTVSLQNFAQLVPTGHWFWERNRSGGILVEHGVHFFDAYGRLAGKPRSTYATHPHQEAVSVLVQYEGGVAGRFYHEFAFPQEVERTEGIFFFERGYMEIEGWIPTRLQGRVLAPAEEVRRLAGRLGISMAVREDAATCFEVSWPDRERSYQEAIVAGMRDMIRRHRDPGYTMTVQPEDARASLVLALAAQRAADTGRSVKL